MPYDGQSSFIHSISCGKIRGIWCVNALWRAIIISTKPGCIKDSRGRTCVNALWRAIIISTSWPVPASDHTLVGVNALWRAIIISTHIIFAPQGLRPWSVNALWRAIIISTVTNQGLADIVSRCQCPMTGNHHFYMNKINVEVLKERVNALWRAIIISTVHAVVRA